MSSDPFAILEGDHRAVEAMLTTLAESEPGPEREQLVQKLTTAFEAHASFEEQAIYPLVPDVMGSEKEEEAEIEHRLAREGIKKLNEMVSQPGFGAAVEMLEGGIGHHVEEEESEMFPALRSAVDDDTKQQLMSELRKAKSAAGLPLIDPDVRDQGRADERGRGRGHRGSQLHVEGRARRRHLPVRLVTARGGGVDAFSHERLEAAIIGVLRDGASLDAVGLKCIEPGAWVRPRTLALALAAMGFGPLEPLDRHVLPMLELLHWSGRVERLAAAGTSARTGYWRFAAPVLATTA